MPLFPEFTLPTFLENTIANISENHIPGFRLLTFLENVIANISGDHIPGVRDVTVDNMLENIVATFFKH